MSVSRHAPTHHHNRLDEARGDEEYVVVDGGISWNKATGNGTEQVRLTNFTATIVADIVKDNGIDRERFIEIEANVGGRVSSHLLPVSRFQRMDWVIDYLGAGAMLYPGPGVRDRARTAIQAMSGDIPERRIIGHLGWVHHNEGKMYAHALGAVGDLPSDEPVEVDVPSELRNYVLPNPPSGPELARALRASLGMLDVAPDRVTIPLYAAIWRSLFGDVDFSIWISGPSGAGKSELAALAQQHYGTQMDRTHLPASWSSTENALEALAFYAKDVILVIDDFAPTGSPGDVSKLHKVADRVMRAQGNASGRSRMDERGGLVAARPPRGLIVGTGEDVPRGHSLRARLVILQLHGERDVDWDRLTHAQRDAANGLYARAVSGEVAMIAEDFDYYNDIFVEYPWSRELIDIGRGVHRRTVPNVEALTGAFMGIIYVAARLGAISSDEHDEYRRRLEAVRASLIETQDEHHATSNPVEQYLTALRSALMRGRAYVAALDGSPPPDAHRWGWMRLGSRTGDNSRQQWRAQGSAIGWLDEENLYLQPEAAFAVAKQESHTMDDLITITKDTMTKRLWDAGLLVSSELSSKTYLVKRTFPAVHGHRRQYVLHLRAAELSGSLDHADGLDDEYDEFDI